MFCEFHFVLLVCRARVKWHKTICQNLLAFSLCLHGNEVREYFLSNDNTSVFQFYWNSYKFVICEWKLYSEFSSNTKVNHDFSGWFRKIRQTTFNYRPVHRENPQIVIRKICGQKSKNVIVENKSTNKSQHFLVQVEDCLCHETLYTKWLINEDSTSILSFWTVVEKQTNF